MFKLLAVVLVLAMGVGVGSQAMAQDDERYVQLFPRSGNFGLAEIDCLDVASLVIVNVVGNTATVTFSDDAAACIANLFMEINPTLYNGPVPVVGILRLPIPTLAADLDTIQVTITTFDGRTASANVKFDPAAVAAANAAAGIAPASVPAAIPVTGALALTGGDISLPLLAGALMTGTGGLLVLASRKRRRD